MNKILTTAAVAFGLVALATQANAKSFQQCDYEAKQYAVANTNQGAATVGSAVVGGLLGLGLSSITGNQNTAAAVVVGAGAGGVVGFVASNAKQKKLYNNYMVSCGAVAPQPVYAPVPVMQPIATFPPPSGSAAVYSSLNVRNGPGANYPKIFGLQPNTVVPVSACAVGTNGKNWCMVGIPGGSGWAAQDYLFFN